MMDRTLAGSVVGAANIAAVGAAVVVAPRWGRKDDSLLGIRRQGSGAAASATERCMAERRS